MAHLNATGNSIPIGHRFARMATVVRMTGLSRATIYRMIADNRFPTQVRIGSRAVAGVVGKFPVARPNRRRCAFRWDVSG
jgi:predicted DNA-binding transcriptional regulator AlpA